MHPARAAIRKDLFRYGRRRGFKQQWVSIVRSPGFRFTYVLRRAQAASNPLSRLFWRWMHRKYMIRYGFQIPVSTEIGEGFYLGHFGTVVINGGATLGSYCNLSPGVVIGRTNRGEQKGVPQIGSHVYIGANAVIVGGISVGNDVLIAPNAYVNKDVPAHTLVLGNPAKYIPQEEATRGYVNHIWEEENPK